MDEPGDILTRASAEGETLAYGDHPDHVVEYFAPDGAPRAVVLFIHGGFWRAAYDRAHVRPLANALARHGYAVVAPEYRRTGGGGGWPHTFDDIRAALTWWRGEAHRRGLGGPAILSGHSAGGHLALWAASFFTGAAGVVPLAPVADLTACANDSVGGDAAVLLMGGTPSDLPDRFAEADPMLLPVDVPVRIVHGVEDDTVPVDMSRRYAREHGAGLRELPATGHFEVIDPLSSAWGDVLAAIGALT